MSYKFRLKQLDGSIRTFPCHGGRALPLKFLVAKHNRLGYVTIKEQVERKGEMKWLVWWEAVDMKTNEVIRQHETLTAQQIKDFTNYKPQESKHVDSFESERNLRRDDSRARQIGQEQPRRELKYG